ncbi:uncharacterized protein LOC124648373 [Lolium rigidum]|uniref:uncharacterized protein LOC124648373 n=1 Tax=Lolium rigidum TaxID=89674 RepID=UPI001F5C983B|nr:uncharacterized protein LOC124648373 [Lolium rigidum]
MAQAPPTLRLRGGDGEVFEVDARRLAALFPAFVLRVPAIDNFGVFKLISAYRKFEASGRHTDPDVENAFVKTIGDLDNLARVVSAAMQLEDHALLNLCLQATIVSIGRARAAGNLQNLQGQEEN